MISRREQVSVGKNEVTALASDESPGGVTENVTEPVAASRAVGRIVARLKSHFESGLTLLVGVRRLSQAQRLRHQSGLGLHIVERRPASGEAGGSQAPQTVPAEGGIAGEMVRVAAGPADPVPSRIP